MKTFCKAGLVMVALLCLTACPSAEQPTKAKQEPAKSPSKPAAEPDDVVKGPQKAKLAALRHNPAPVLPARPDQPVWKRQHPQETAGSLTDIAAVDGAVVVTTSDGEIFRVTLEGEWQKLGPSGGEGLVEVASAKGPGGQWALAVLDVQGRVRLSVDGGKTWRQVRQSPEGWAAAPAVGPFSRRQGPFFALDVRWVGDKLALVACGRATHVLSSMDGAQSWVEDQLEGLQNLTDCAIGPKGTLVTAGERGVAFRRDPGLKDWSHITLGKKPQVQALAIDARNADRFMMLGQGGAVRVTSNRGNAWEDNDENGVEFSAAAALPDGRMLVATLKGEVRAGVPGKGWKVLRPADGQPILYLSVSDAGLFAAGPHQIWRSEAAGKPWQPLWKESTSALADVYATGQGRAVVVGSRGTVLEASPGNAWGALGKLPFDGVDLNAVAFSGGRFGWIAAADGQVAVTEDGARSWKVVDPDPARNVPLNAVTALDPLNVFVADDEGRVYASGDKGMSWRPVAADKARQEGITALAMVRQKEGAGLLLGGRRGTLWSGRPSDETLSAESISSANGVVAIETAEDVSWVLDVTGLLLSRRGAKGPWRVLAGASGVEFASLAMSPQGQGVVLTSAGQVMRTEDGGQSWWLVERASARVLHDVVWAGKPGVFVVVGHGGMILRSDDAGRTWTPLEGAQAEGRTLTTVKRVGEALVAVGYRGAAVLSRDEGLTWEPWQGVPKEHQGRHLTTIAQAPGGAMALGGIGVLWYRPPGGLWQALEPATEKIRELRSLAIDDRGGVLAVESSGRVWLKPSKDAPLSMVAWKAPGHEQTRWKDVVVLQWSPLEVMGVTDTGASFVAKEPGQDVGAWSAVVGLPRSFQGQGRWEQEGGRRWLIGPDGLWGQNPDGRWAQVLSDFPVPPSAMSFADARQGVAVGQGGALFSTQDGGVSWVSQGTATRADLKAVKVTSKGRAWAVGAGGVVLERAAP